MVLGGLETIENAGDIDSNGGEDSVVAIMGSNAPLTREIELFWNLWIMASTMDWISGLLECILAWYLEFWRFDSVSALTRSSSSRWKCSGLCCFNEYIYASLGLRFALTILLKYNSSLSVHSAQCDDIFIQGRSLKLVVFCKHDSYRHLSTEFGGTYFPFIRQKTSKSYQRKVVPRLAFDIGSPKDQRHNDLFLLVLGRVLLDIILINPYRDAFFS